MTYSNSFNPAYSSVLGLLPFLKSGRTNPASVYVESPIPESDSSALQLSPTQIINKADGTKLGQKYEPLFDTYPNPETFLKRTKSLSSKALNANLQLKLSDNPRFSNFLNVGMKGFEIPYYSFDTPYATNAFSDYINAVTLGSYVTGAPNFFAEAEFWDSVPLIEGFDGNAYDKELISKPFHQVGYPEGLSSEAFVDLINAKTTTGSNSSGSSSNSAAGQLDLEKLRSAINASNGDSITVSKDLLNALVDSADGASTSIDYQTSAIQKSLYGSNGIKNAMSDGGAGLYSSFKNLSGLNDMDSLLGDKASSYQSATSSSSASGKSSLGSLSGMAGYGFSADQAKMVSDTKKWAESLAANPSAASTASSATGSATSALASNLPALQQMASAYSTGSLPSTMPTAMGRYPGLSGIANGYGMPSSLPPVSAGMPFYGPQPQFSAAPYHTPSFGVSPTQFGTMPAYGMPPQQTILVQFMGLMQQFLGVFQQLLGALRY